MTPKKEPKKRKEIDEFDDVLLIILITTLHGIV